MMATRYESILVVDDEEAVRQSLRSVLVRQGYLCGQAADAEQALTELTNYPFELAILDVKMPGKSGLELLPEIRVTHPYTAVIMATAVNDTDIAIECMRQGAIDYMTKPFDLSEVSVGVEHALQRRRLELEIRDHLVELEQKVEAQRKALRQLYRDAIESLVTALEAKDRYTAGHSRRVMETTTHIGRELALSADDLEDIRWGSLLHDVGKIAINPDIQNKAGKLTPDEYRHIMIHAHVGPGIVKPLANNRILDIIAHHHDHYDGSGLVQTVIGENIPLGARIVAVADAFDAMTSDRPYRPAMSRPQALAEIKRCTGTQFDPVVVSAFLTMAQAVKYDGISVP